MSFDVKKLINERENLILELKELVREYSFLVKQKNFLETEYFEGKINYMEYDKRKKELYEKGNWEETYPFMIKKRVTELEQIDKRLVEFFVNYEKYVKFKEISITSVSKKKKVSFIDKISQQFKQISEYVKDPRKYLQELIKGIFKSEIREIDEKLLAAYNEILREHLKETQVEHIEKLSLKAESLEDLIFQKANIDEKKLSWLDKIKLWYLRKFKLKKLLEKSEKPQPKEKKSWLKRFIDKYIIGESVPKKGASVKSLIQLRRFREEAKKKKNRLSFEEEVKALKSLIELQKEKKKSEETEIYVPSIYGIISNMFVKNIGLWLINQFPDAFRKLYQNLQLANIKILSSTYVNMMIFSSILSGIWFFIVGFILSIPLKLPWFIGLALGWFLGLIAAVITFIAFYTYPNSKIFQRKRNIRTNLPFAIIHMSAIAGSGLTPLKMFELIAEGNEFGEVSEEFRKIVKYVNLFGVDLITAIKTAIETNPSPEMKDFLNGLITSIESGGDIILYLTVKAEEILNLYKLEREKTNDNIAIFSEIYMGVMITAPMFFILITSIIGFIGGSFMGLSAKVLLGIVTYFLIPFMNVIFYIVLDKILIGF